MADEKMSFENKRGQWRIVYFSMSYTDEELLKKTKAELVSMLQDYLLKGKELEDKVLNVESRIDELEFKLKEDGDTNATLIEQVDQLHFAAKALLAIMAHEEIIYEPGED